jgi:hypothetical protein
MKQPPLHLVLKYHFNNWGKGFLRLGLFMIVCFIFSGCQDFHQAKGSTKWMEKDSTEKQVLKSLSYLKLNSNKHKTFSGAAPELLKKYIVELNTIKNKYPELSEKILSGKADSLKKVVGIPKFSCFQEYSDGKYLNDTFLVHNITIALEALRTAPWRDSVSFDIFCEYILPYKIAHEVADNWRDTLYPQYSILTEQSPALANIDSLYNYYMEHAYYSLKSGGDLNSKYPSESNYSWLSFSNQGDCVDRCRNMIYHLRAAGVPATFDYIPAWGNRPRARHAYVGLGYRKQQLAKKLENANDPHNLVNDLNAAMSTRYLHIFKEEVLPDGLYMQYEKTIPKIYRETWSEQSNMTKLIEEVPQEELDMDLIKPNMKDVTSQYLETADVTTFRSFTDSTHIGYLSTFSLSRWIPVAFSRFNWQGKAVFKDIGKNILYLPMIKKYGKLIPYGHPFILDNSGKKKILKPSFRKKINMHLIRKFPLFSYTATHVIDLKGCIISGSNDYRLDHSDTLAVIDRYPFFLEKIKINTSDKYRFIKIESPENKKIRLAYLSCFPDSSGTLIRHNDVRYLSGEITGQYKNLFDDDLNTYSVGRMLLMDLGNSKKISEIRICPRSDTNYIIPGNSYELFYWDKGWKSAGKKTAEDCFLNYTGVPSETVYWLKCLSEGKEERIFTYKNGKQIWW